MSERIWECKIGGEVENFLPGLGGGADGPMREAIRRAFVEVTGEEPEFIFSGWGGSLTEPERAVVEDREPSEEHYREWQRRQEAGRE